MLSSCDHAETITLYFLKFSDADLNPGLFLNLVNFAVVGGSPDTAHHLGGKLSAYKVQYIVSPHQTQNVDTTGQSFHLATYN